MIKHRALGATTAAEARLRRRLGMGRLQAARWIGPASVLIGTSAALWIWDLEAGRVEPWLQQGVRLLELSRPAGVAWLVTEEPQRELLAVALAEGRVVQRLAIGGELVDALAIAPGGGEVARGDTARLLHVHELAGGAARLQLEHPDGYGSRAGCPQAIWRGRPTAL